MKMAESSFWSANKSNRKLPIALWVHSPKSVCVFSYLPRNNWLILAQPLGPSVKAAEGTA